MKSSSTITASSSQSTLTPHTIATACPALAGQPSTPPSCTRATACLTTAGRDVQPSRGTLLEHLDLLARGDYISGPHGSKTFGETDLGRLQPPGHCINSRLKHSPSICVKMPIFLFWSLSLRTSRGQRCLWKPK